MRKNRAWHGFCFLFGGLSPFLLIELNLSTSGTVPKLLNVVLCNEKAPQDRGARSLLAGKPVVEATVFVRKGRDKSFKRGRDNRRVYYDYGNDHAAHDVAHG